MRHSITSVRRIRRQRGFSVLEILIATVLISLLVTSGLYYANVGDKADTVDIATSKAVLVVRFPEALLSVYAKKQTLLGASEGDLTKTGSVRTGIPATWEVAGGDDKPTATALSVKLTFEKSEVVEVLKTYLDDSKDTTLVSEVAVDSDNGKVLTVTYRLE